MKKRDKIIFFVSMAVFLGAAAFGITYYVSVKQNEKAYEKLSEEAVKEETQFVKEQKEEPQPDPVEEIEEKSEPESESTADIPVDFVALQTKNPDIYGWIRIPGTQVDYPVVQSGTDDGYYLNHTVEGAEGLPGSIYTENLNRKDFTDGLTVIYGHNMRDGSMFGGLDAYTDKAYMKEHSQLIIYTPEHQYTYRVFAAVTYDNRHILHSYDCNDKIQIQSFLDSQDRLSGCRNEEVQVTGEDRIIILSTCNGNNDQRFLVEAVLTDEK